MAPNQATSDPNASGANQSSAPALPAINLPKGGGAIRGIGEKFAANPVTGTGSMSVPIATSPGRSGFGPQLSLSYDSGAGNGPFGFGWSLSLPSITRKTDKGLPQYRDAEESDVFILSGAEDLVPVFKTNPTTGEFVKDANGNFVYDESSRDGYLVRRFRPRIEGLFAKIERWTNLHDPGDVFWRSITKDNVTTFYGRPHENVDGSVDTNHSRIADPTDPSRIFSWLICQSHDDKGSAMCYEYVAEDSRNVDASQVSERNRTDQSRSANRYLKRILYGNATSILASGKPVPRLGPDLSQMKWLFEVVFDYGDGHYRALSQPTDDPQFASASVSSSSVWPMRIDSFSSYRAGFEVRTYRLCRRVLMCHHFSQELGIDDYLVRTTEFTYAERPIASFIASVTQSGYVLAEGGGPNKYLKKSLPPVEFSYSSVPGAATLSQQRVEEVDAESLENLPIGLDGGTYQWVDLDGEGTSGILIEQGEGWYYKRNLSPNNQIREKGSDRTAVRLGALELVSTTPAAGLTGGPVQFLDLAGDGQLDVVQMEGPVRGFYERTTDESWESFQPFASWPNLTTRDPNLKFVDLTGDGHADILIAEDDVFVWYPSLAKEGFGPAERTSQSLDEEKGPRLVFNDGTQSFYLADLSGDGLSDLARIRNGEVCYWPNLGYGRFGAKVTMDGAPWFDPPDQFDQRRIRLADTDGSGTTDILYLRRDGVQIYFNQSGNSWSDPVALAQFPPIDNIASIQAFDLLGNGTACLVWSSPMLGSARRPMRYIALMPEKPHLLVTVKNNLGAETRVHYASSTKFYLDDKQAGTPWITKLPFPVHVVERVETYDWISRNRFVTRYKYHHGYFDGIEREFRGFGMVEQWDTEELASLKERDTIPDATNVDESSYVPPAYTKTWFHTGAYPQGQRVSRVFEEEYYRESDLSEGVAGLVDDQFEAMQLPDTVLPSDLTGDEIHEAIRSLKAAILRQEVYALDGTDEADRPYSVSERNYTINRLQPFGGNRHAVFFTHARETIDFHYERKLYDISGRKLADPRVTHSMVLAVDDYGNELQSAAIAYGRRHPDPDSTLTRDDQANQGRIHITSTESTYTNPVLTDDAYRTPLLAEARTYELIKLLPDSNQPDITNLFGFDEMAAKLAQADDGQHDLPYEDLYATGATTNHPYRRLIERVRSLYRKDDLTGALPLGTMESRALAFQNYKLAFTPGLLALYQRNQQNLLTNPASILRDEGGYVLSDDQKAAGLFPSSDPNEYWWIPSGRIFFSPGATDTPPQELANATAHFFLPRRFQDPFGNNATVLYDAKDLLILETEDALQNIITTGDRDSKNNITNRNDYRLMQPTLVTDPNGNRTAVAFDTLGLVAGTAVMGKSTETFGDTLTNFNPDLAQSDINQFFSNPKGPVAAKLLAGATSRIVYDLDRFQQTSTTNPNDPTAWEPVFAATIARETHVSDLGQNQQTRLQIGFGYSDGFGREIQKKLQAEPGPVVPNGVRVDPRWVGSGWTIFNNKGKPVRQYEPFFDDTHDFKYGVIVGVSPVLFYDPVGRVIATLCPNQTWEKVIFDPWRQESWDANDTVLIADPSLDADVGACFQRIPSTDYLPTWYGQRNGGEKGPQEQDAATKAAAHAGTPAVAWFDTLGRPFLTVADNATAGKYATHVELDIEGNQRSVTDALGRKIMTYDYDMLGTKIHQNSVDAGERWILSNVTGKPMRGWDSRDHTVRHVYDVLLRPTSLFVQTGNNPEHLLERILYGEGKTNDQALNLRTRVLQQFDGAGVATNNQFDFKGNLLKTTRQLLQDYKDEVDWSQSPALESETFSASTAYDALNRPIALTTPDASVIQPVYNEANLLEQLNVNLRGGATATPFVTNIDYNAKGQREQIEYGNGAKTVYDYDPQTFRLIRLQTTRKSDNAALQDLTYHYDPVGNITSIQDAAQQAIYFSNRVVTPSNDYSYDAIYHLINAKGREHIGQVADPQPEYDWNDFPRVNLPHPNDGNAMRAYTEQYDYDAVGNFLQMIHQAANGNWARRYAYSLNAQPPTNNRLQTTSLPGDPTNGPYNAKYNYDPHGNMIQMPHLPVMEWDFKDQLHATQQQVVNNGPGEKTYYVYDAGGERVRRVAEKLNGTKKSERIYLGGYEVYRQYDSGGTTTLERQSLHVMDDKRRIALVETKTVDNNVPPASLPSTAVRYQVDNHLGTACLELDELAGVISYEEYYPYGSTSYQAGRTLAEVSLKRYRYTGKERDEETGFFYHGVRYYAPWLGRWTSTDPKAIGGGINLYAYANKNPIVLRDPNGRDPQEDPKNNSKKDDKMHADMVGKILPEQTDELKEPESKEPEKNTEEDKDTPAPITQASATNSGVQGLKRREDNVELQLGGSFDTGGAGTFPNFQARYGRGITPRLSLHGTFTIASAGPSSPAGFGRIPNTSPGSLGFFGWWQFQGEPGGESGSSLYFGTSLLFAQNPPPAAASGSSAGASSEQIQAANPAANVMFAHTNDIPRGLPILGPARLKFDFNAGVTFVRFGTTNGAPASDIFTEYVGLNLARSFLGERLTLNVENRVDFNQALNNEVPTLPGAPPVPSAFSARWTLGGGVQYSDLAGHWSIGLNVLRAQETPLGSSATRAPVNYTIFPSISGKF